jgi:hypothetical protein
VSRLAVLAIVLGACAGAAGPGPAQGAVAFSEVATTQSSKYDGPPALMVGTSDAASASIVALVPQAAAAQGRVLVAAFEGGQRTGGFAIRIDSIERTADRLIVHATFTAPPPGGIVTQVLTSPVHVVSIAQADAVGLREALFVDSAGTERSRTTLR